MGTTSNSSILSKQSPSPSYDAVSCQTQMTTDQISENVLLGEKQELDELLNAAMTALYAQFGANCDPSIQETIHQKMNLLKKMVSSIEQTAKKKHIEIDGKLDLAQNALRMQTNRSHQNIEDYKEKELLGIYSKFGQWVDGIDFTQKQQQKQNKIQQRQDSLFMNMKNTKNTNKGKNFVIIADEHCNIINTFVVPKGTQIASN